MYDHLLRKAELETPAQLIQRFRSLFVEGSGYPDREIPAALERIAATRFADHEFKFILNRCCHILINRWQTRTQLQSAIPALVAIFEEQPSNKIYVRPRAARRLRELVIQFLQSEQYAILRRLAQVISEGEELEDSSSRPLGTLIRRYPYLYNHCLLSEDSTYEQKQTVQQIQGEIQRQFEVDLSQYVTYQIRRSQIARLRGETTGQIRLPAPVQNPTLLTDSELASAIKHFVGRVDATSTYRDMAQRFQTHMNHPSSFKGFKEDLYSYLVSSIDPAYGRRLFNEQLYAQIQSTLVESDQQKVSDLLMVRTCSQLLNFLVVDSPQRPQHFVFLDLINNLGATQTTGLILKIVLFCRKVKPYMEKRMSILFNHYESFARGGVDWLVKVLENVNVALATNFGAVDLSFIR